eukprot:IDg3769t1
MRQEFGKDISGDKIYYRWAELMKSVYLRHGDPLSSSKKLVATGEYFDLLYESESPFALGFATKFCNHIRECMNAQKHLSTAPTRLTARDSSYSASWIKDFNKTSDQSINEDMKKIIMSIMTKNYNQHPAISPFDSIEAIRIAGIN